MFVFTITGDSKENGVIFLSFAEKSSRGSCPLRMKLLSSGTELRNLNDSSGVLCACEREVAVGLSYWFFYKKLSLIVLVTLMEDVQN